VDHDPPISPYVVTYTTLLSLAKSEADARLILKEMADHDPPISPNVVTYNTLLSLAKSEADARLILKEMADHDPPISPDVVTYTTLLTKLSGEKKALAVLRLTRRRGCSPNEVLVVNAIGRVETFDAALRIIDFTLRQGWFAGRGAFEAAFAKPIYHLSAKELLAKYHELAYSFDSALGNPIRQYRRTGQHEQALLLALEAPHNATAQKLYRERYTQCKDFFKSRLAEGNDEDNLYYAYGIAAALNEDWMVAVPMLMVALERSYSDKRADHIKSLLRRAE